MLFSAASVRLLSKWYSDGLVRSSLVDRIRHAGGIAVYGTSSDQVTVYDQDAARRAAWNGSISRVALNPAANRRWHGPVNYEQEFSVVSRSLICDLWQLRELRDVDISGSRAADEDIRGILALELLESLDLEGTCITDEALLIINKVPRLRVLNVCETVISDRGISYLCECKSLERLKVGSHLQGVSEHGASGGITSSGLRCLLQVPTLRIIDIKGCSMSGITDVFTGSAIRVNVEE